MSSRVQGIQTGEMLSLGSAAAESHPEIRDGEPSINEAAAEASNDEGGRSGTTSKDYDLISKFWADIVSDSE